MSIQASELIWRRSQIVNDDPGNGGRLGYDVSASNAKNNIWPDVPQAERTNSSTKWRKMFILVLNTEADGNGNLGLPLIAPRLFVETRTPGEDIQNIFLGTQTDTQSGTPQTSPDLYGMGELDAIASVSDGTIDVAVEDWANYPIFRDGDVIRISDKADVNAAGNEEYHTINGAPSNVGNVVTLTLTGTLANDYASGSGTKISSVIEPGTVQCTVDGYTKTSVSGTHTIAGITTDNSGTIEQGWTVEFSDDTTYTISGDTVGPISGSFSTVGDVTPSNPSASGDYFTLLSSEFGGTFADGDTIEFSTHPAAIPVWYERRVPVASGSLSNNAVIVAIDGESS